MQRLKSRRAVSALCVLLTLATSLAGLANRTGVAQAQASALDVTIIVDGAERQVRTNQATVSATLREAGVTVGPADRIYPKSSAKIKDGTKIRVTRVVEKIVLNKEPIAFATKRKFTNKLRADLTKVTSEGERGLKHLKYKVRYEDGVVKDRKLIESKVVTKPKNKVIMVGTRGTQSSRGFFTSKRVLTMHATAYDPGPRSCGRNATGRTCTGMTAGYGVVAVDPRVIPLGSRLYVDGYGFAIAGDRGRAIKGHRIDLGFDSYRAAKKFGRKNVTVHILE